MTTLVGLVEARVAELAAEVQAARQAEHDLRAEERAAENSGLMTKEEAEEDARRRKEILATDADLLNKVAEVDREAHEAAQVAQQAVWSRYPGLREAASQAANLRHERLEAQAREVRDVQSTRRAQAVQAVRVKQEAARQRTRERTVAFFLAVNDGPFVLPTWDNPTKSWQRRNGVILMSDRPSKWNTGWIITIQVKHWRKAPGDDLGVEFSFFVKGRGPTAREALDEAEREALASGLFVRSETPEQQAKREKMLAEAKVKAARKQAVGTGS